MPLALAETAFAELGDLLRFLKEAGWWARAGRKVPTSPWGGTELNARMASIKAGIAAPLSPTLRDAMMKQLDPLLDITAFGDSEKDIEKKIQRAQDIIRRFYEIAGFDVPGGAATKAPTRRAVRDPATGKWRME